MIEDAVIDKIYDNNVQAVFDFNLEVKDGELIETGTHDELMQIQDGEYKHLYEMQFKHQEEIA